MQLLALYKQELDRHLEAFFNDKIEKAQYIDPASVEMVDLLKQYTLRGGKRLRAALVYYGYRCIAAHNPEVLRASMSAELIQSFLLIHDDIMDNDDLRRGGPSLHKAYETLARRYKTDSKHFGASMAILAGDICYSFANEIIASSDFPSENKIKALAYLNHTVHTVIYGQLLDILSNYRKEVDPVQIQAMKTTAYTFEGPLYIGALLAGADRQQLRALSNYARPLGLAFGLQDDILGMFGDEKKLGKPVGTDLKEGKKTMLILKALENANKQEKAIIKKALGRQPKQLKQVQDIIIKTGSLEHSKRLMHSLAEDAKDALEKASFKPKGKNFLLSLPDQITEREY